MNATCKTIEHRHASLGLWFVLAIGAMSGFLLGAAGVVLAFAALMQIKTYLVG